LKNYTHLCQNRATRLQVLGDEVEETRRELGKSSRMLSHECELGLGRHRDALQMLCPLRVHQGRLLECTPTRTTKGEAHLSLNHSLHLREVFLRESLLAELM